MSLLRLTASGDDLKCPFCKKWLDVEWLTDYSDPVVGDHEAECPLCHELISINAYHGVSVLKRTKKNKENNNE